MAQIKDITVVNPHTLELQSDAFKGDTIDLNDLQQVDVSYIENLIKQNQDRIYNQKIEGARAQWKLEAKNFEDDLEKKHQATINDLNIKIAQLSQQVSSASKEASLQISKEYDLKVQSLQFQIDTLQRNLKSEVAQAKLQQEMEDKEIIAKANADLMQDKIDFNNKLNEKDKKIDELTRIKSASSVKKLGEDLETWCNNEYKNYELSGFQYCTWEKDNTLVLAEGDSGKGTKADYIFRVYSSEEHSEDTELASVCMDMKNENPDSNPNNKKKNSDYYKKLDSDRLKKKCSYAALVSELEMDGPNDPPIFKVKDYKDMYVVRPAYFISFLSIIQSLGNKYNEIINEVHKEQRDFKDSQEILSEFAAMKDTYFDKPLATLEKQIAEIQKQSQNINEANAKLSATANNIADSVIETMREKIDRFDIQKVVKHIENHHNSK
jgi:hypothetical protein